MAVVPFALGAQRVANIGQLKWFKYSIQGLGYSFLVLLAMAVWDVVWPLDLQIPINQVPYDFESYLAQSELAAKPNYPEVAKHVLWANEKHEKSEIAFLYIHGFSATALEINPVMENLGKAFSANIYFTRLPGHGKDGLAMGMTTAEEWFTEAEESLEVAQRIGRKVIVVGTSTGSSLGIYLAAKHPDLVTGLVLLSPNFRPNPRVTPIFSRPFGSILAKIFIGRQHCFKPDNVLNEKYWTTCYDSVAVATMMDVVKYANEISLESISLPTLILFSPNDDVVSIPLTKEAFARLGAAKKELFPVNNTRHLVAGDIESPQTTAEVTAKIAEFLSAL